MSELDLKKPIADFSYYKPLNKNQKDFHDSKAKNKLLVGPYRSGKTYPAIHEDIFICGDNPKHEFGVFRDTEEVLKTNIEKDFIYILRKANALKYYSESKHNAVLWNDCTVRFRPLTLKREKLKGMNMCGYHIDDPNTKRFKKVIKFLPSRLTNPPGVKANYFASVFTANYEGHDLLWEVFMRRREQGGDGMFAYWFCVTADNTTNEPDYITNQEAWHSQAYMKRYFYGDLSNFVGLVYSEYDPKYHDDDLSWIHDDHSLTKILVVDPGITHPTVVLKAATDYNNIYFYDEWARTDIRTGDLGDHLVECLNSQEHFSTVLIDPKSCAREQTSGVSPRQILDNDFGIKNIKLANNNVLEGIEVTKGIMSLRELGGVKTTHLKVDPEKCPLLCKELETLNWKEPADSNNDEFAYKEEPVDIDNDATDCMRYGSVFFRKKLRSMMANERLISTNRIARFNKRMRLKIYQRRPDVIKHLQAREIIKFHNKSRKKAFNRFHPLTGKPV